ncbi:hypothetical protein BDV93DRAFT_520276, partial [Ceratobasidium sp. AG-I]
VCPHWRRVAINTSYLWTFIDVLRVDDTLRDLEAIDLWLERSQNLPLRLRVGKGETDIPGFSSTKANELLDGLDNPLALLIRSCMSRLRSVALKYYHPDTVTNILSTLGSREVTHTITELAIRQAMHLQLNTISNLFLTGLDSLLQPLRVLRLERGAIELKLIPCQNLVELQLINLYLIPSRNTLENLLRSNPNLEVFAFHGACVSWPPSLSAPQPIELPSLRSIDVQTESGTLIWLFPALLVGGHDLSLSVHATSLSGNAGLATLSDTLVSFFRRTRIKSFSIGGNCPAFAPLFGCLPHLLHLGLDLFQVVTRTFDGIESTSGTMADLCTIEIDEYYPSNEEMHPGLCFLLSLPSVRQIILRPDGYYGQSDTKARVLKLLSKGGITAPVVLSYESKIPAISQPSPFAL